MAAPELFTATATVQPEWIDYNGHMNMGYYLVAFDQRKPGYVYRYGDTAQHNFQ